MLEPTASPDLRVAEGKDPSPAVAPKRHGAKRGFVVNMVATIVCPCVPAAQVASAVGLSYFVMLLSFAAIYISSAVLYMLAANADHTFVEGTSPLSAYAAQTVTYIGGPLFSIITALYKYANTRYSSGLGTLVTSVGELNEQMNANMSVNNTSVAFIGGDLALNLLLALAILQLHKRLDRRTDLNVGEDASSCSSTMGVLCCASCSLFEMVWVAKESARKPQFSLGAIDELPAFEGGDLPGKTGNTLSTTNEVVVACPA